MRHTSLAIVAMLCLCILTYSLLRAGGQGAIPAATDTVRQDYYGFSLTHVKVNHQGKNVFNISVLYRYPADLPAADYPDVNLIRKDVLAEIITYPNATDYWEVYDSNLANHLFRKYAKEMEALRIKLDIAPGSGEPFARTSLVTRARSGSAPIIP